MKSEARIRKELEDVLKAMESNNRTQDRDIYNFLETRAFALNWVLKGE